MRRVTTVADLRQALAEARLDEVTVGLVPTMGALHEGHLSLVRLAAAHADLVVVSVFVNPTQFDRAEDLETYPRDLDGDEAALAELGEVAPALVFAPPLSEMYPREPLTTVQVRQLTDRLCGASRPGHFDGVATVVTKLLHVVRPDVAVFGRKDRQQLEVIRRLVVDLDVDVRIIDGPTVREQDGLALSSRNRNLAHDDRPLAAAIPRALRDGVLAARSARDRGEPISPVAVRAAGMTVIRNAPGVELEYLEVVDPTTMAPAVSSARPTSRRAPTKVLMAVAARVGPVRLIDNVEIGDLDDEERLLDAVGPPPAAPRPVGIGTVDAGS